MTSWYLARGAGLSAVVLLSLSTCLGALVSGAAPGGGSPATARRYVLQYLHRACAGLGLTVLVLHIGAILSDSYAHVGWLGALVPFTSAYRPVWIALGSIATYTFVGVALLGLARGRMAGSARGARLWRALHSLAYLGWAAGMWHGFLSGSDSSATWVRALYVACLAGVVGAGAARLLTARRPAPDRFAGGPPRTAQTQPAARPLHGAVR